MRGHGELVVAVSGLVLLFVGLFGAIQALWMNSITANFASLI